MQKCMEHPIKIVFPYFAGNKPMDEQEFPDDFKIPIGL